MYTALVTIPFAFENYFPLTLDVKVNLAVPGGRISLKSIQPDIFSATLVLTSKGSARTFMHTHTIYTSYTHTNIHTHARTHTYTHTGTHTQTHTHAHTNIHVHTHTHTHVHARTHAHTHLLSTAGLASSRQSSSLFNSQ